MLQEATSNASSTFNEGQPTTDQDSMDGFRPAGRAQRSRSSSLSTLAPTQGGPSPQASSVASEPALGPRISAQEASHIVEQAAAGMRGSDRLRLWREWLAQVLGSEGRAFGGLLRFAPATPGICKSTPSRNL